MPKLPLVFYPTPSLQKPSDKVADIGLAKKFLPDMIDTMLAEKGIGIAAAQIGHNIRLAIINKDAGIPPLAKGGLGGVLSEHLVIINPKIFSASKEMDEDSEGCLSIPGVEGVVARHRKIKVRYTALNGREVKIKATGLFSRVLQHEIDHLDGVLFIDRAVKITRGEKHLLKLNKS